MSDAALAILRGPRSLLVVAAFAGLLLLSGCGGGNDKKVVANAAAKSLRAKGARVSLTETSRSAGKVATFVGTGNTNAKTPQTARLNIDFNTSGSTGVIRELLKGPMVYMISPALRPSIPQGKAWVKVDLRKAQHGARFDFGSLSAATPNQLLDLLAAAVKPVKVGSESIDGEQTTHFRATIDPKKISDATQYSAVEAWVDGGGMVRRAHVTYVSGGARTTLTATFSHYGEGFSVALPDPSVVYDAP